MYDSSSYGTVGGNQGGKSLGLRKKSFESFDNVFGQDKEQKAARDSSKKDQKASGSSRGRRDSRGGETSRSRRGGGDGGGDSTNKDKSRDRVRINRELRAQKRMHLSSRKSLLRLSQYMICLEEWSCRICRREMCCV